MLWSKLRRRRLEAREVTFCESCSQVCASGCRSSARIEQMQAKVLSQVGYLR